MRTAHVKRMLLVFPYTGRDCVPALPPLSACFLSTSARNAGWCLDVLDAQLCDPAAVTLQLSERVGQYEAFGISAYSGYIEQAMAVATLIRRRSSSPIVWGGPHPTLFPKQLEGHELADFVVAGYGERPLQTLLQHDFVYPKQVLYGDPDPLLAEHSADYSIYEMNRYRAANGEPVASLITSRGCKFNCAFCINAAQKQSAIFLDENVVEATVRELSLRHGIGRLTLMDEHFYRDDERVLWFCSLMGRHGLSWEANIRADIVARLSDEVMEALARSHCQRINMGMESASERILKMLRKGITVSDCLAAVHRCKQYGIGMSASFMINLPTERAKERAATMTLARLLRSIGVVVFGPMRYRPVPGTVITDQMVHDGQLDYPSTLEDWVTSGFASKYASNDWSNVNW